MLRFEHSILHAIRSCCYAFNILYGTCHTLSLLRFEYYTWNLWNTSSATLWNILHGTCHTLLMLCFLNHKSTELAIHSQCLSMLRFEYSLGDLLHPLDAMLWQKTYGTCHTLSMFLNATDWIFSRGIVTRSWCCALNILYGTCHTLLMLYFEPFSGEPVTRSWRYAWNIL